MNKIFMMSLLELHTCRLCRSTEFLEDINEVNRDMTLDLKIDYCIGLKVQLGDGLPSTICKTCVDNIDKFFKFKQKCLEMDFKFKAIKNSTNRSIGNNITDGDLAPYHSDTHANTCGNMIKISKCTDFQNLENKSNNDTKTNIQMDIKDQTKGINKLNNLIYQCELCGRLFKMKTVLDQHLMIHSGVKPFACQICPKTFARAENRKIHMRSHMGIKPYICEICGGSSTKHQDLIRHMKIHSDERKYSCPTCNRSFKRSSDVTSHMRTHTGLRPYSCRTCAKTYTSHNGLRKHYKKNCKELKSGNLI